MLEPSAPDADQPLVSRVQQGDKKRFDLLVIKYQHRIMAVVSRFIRDHAEVQDVAQETFIKAYRALPNFRVKARFILGFIASLLIRRKLSRLSWPPPPLWI